MKNNLKGIGLKVDIKSDVDNYNSNYEEYFARFGIFNGSFLERNKPGITKQFNFIIDPETSFLNYPKKLIREHDLVFQYTNKLTDGNFKKRHLIEDGKEYLDPEFIRERLVPLTENVLQIERGHLSFEDKSIANGIENTPIFVSNYSAPYFSLMIETYPDEMVELNVESYSLMNERISKEDVKFNNIISIIELSLNDLKYEVETKNCISKILSKNLSKSISLKLIRYGNPLTEVQLRTLYRILKWLKEKNYTIISQNLGLEGTILSWLLRVPLISRGCFSERINKRKKIEERKEDDKKEKVGPFFPSEKRLYDPNTFHFRKNVKCNCDYCRIRKAGKDGTHDYASLGHNFSALINENQDMVSIKHQNLKGLIQLKLEEAIRESNNLGIKKYHVNKLKRTMKIISEE